MREKKKRKLDPKAGFCSMEAREIETYAHVHDPLIPRVKHTLESRIWTTQITNSCFREDLENRWEESRDLLSL